MIGIEVKRTIGNDEVVLKTEAKKDDIYEKVAELRVILKDIDEGRTKKKADSAKKYNPVVVNDEVD
ncbi:MAG: hypothetical protein ACC612_09945 [Methanomethylovorans sp.]|uniref:hypothetical protein n=1 Tax=Methanomethylovorans sp. TaxID=2758717 RepID=UPI003531276D